MASAEIKPTYNFSDHLRRRSLLPSFIMVEIGHDSLPVALQQPRPFTGTSAYIGIETWLRDPTGTKQGALAKRVLNACTTEDNIFFIKQDAGGKVIRDTDGHRTSYYHGSYEPTTPLPPGSADEVFVSNVFGDPLIAYATESSGLLIKEIARITRPSGVVVIRETITPRNTWRLTPENLITHGLEPIANVTPDHDDWPSFELVYNGELSTGCSIVAPPATESFYLIANRT